jgi:opacity protein-like surface antigen
MRRVRAVWMVVGGLVALGPAQAQVPIEYRDDQGVTGPVVWNVGGMLGVPVGSSSDRTNVGGGFTLGATFNPSHPVGIQFEYGANWASLKTSSALANAGVSGNGFLQYFDLNAMIRPLNPGRFSVYLIGGGGLYYRSASVNRVTGVAVAPYCDPYLFFCSATAVPASSVVGSRHSWDFGLDAGLGLTFGVSPPVRFYVEARYHYIFGPSFTDSSGASQKADGQLIPIVLGAQF